MPHHQTHRSMEKTPSFLIVFCEFSDGFHRLSVNASTTIHEVMNKVRSFPDKESLRGYLLLFDGVDLLQYPTTDTLSSHGVEDQDQLILTQDGPFQIRVMVERSEPHQREAPDVTVHTLLRIGELKMILHRITGIPVEEQNLYYCHNPMSNDDATLATYGFFKARETKDPPGELENYGHLIVLRQSGCQSIYDHFKEDLSVPKRLCELKTTIIVNASSSIGNIRLHLKVNLEDGIRTAKRMIFAKVSSFKADSPLTYVVEGRYVLLFNRKLLDDKSLTFEECGIKGQDERDDRFLLCPKDEFLVTVVVIHVEDRRKIEVHTVPVRCSDTVATLRTKILEVANIPLERRILLKFDDMWLEDEHCLVEYDIVEYPYIEGTPNYYMSKKGNCLVEALSYGAPLSADI